jgi:hypothetical protein
MDLKKGTKICIEFPNKVIPDEEPSDYSILKGRIINVNNGYIIVDGVSINDRFFLPENVKVKIPTKDALIKITTCED